jgi:hypothetical protein
MLSALRSHDRQEYTAVFKQAVEASWNVMAHVQKRFRLSAKRASPFKSEGASVQSTTDSRGVRISRSNAGYTMFRGSVKSTTHSIRRFPLHFPSRASPCAITFQLDSTDSYHFFFCNAPNRPQGPKGVPGRLRPRIFFTFGTTRVVGRQSHAPAAFIPRGIPWYSFLEAESTPGHMVPSVATENSPMWHHRESIPRPYD